jgi:hypothetical protein
MAIKYLYTPKERWEQNIPHHSNSVRVKKLIDKIQEKEDHGIKFGGDGDLGETILYILDEYFEQENPEDFFENKKLNEEEW